LQPKLYRRRILDFCSGREKCSNRHGDLEGTFVELLDVPEILREEEGKRIREKR